ncbi:hypothetical protein CHH78_19195 [Shouchella clausii]|jgi:TRAP-type C4-dicarboxylate transport system permease small subunit|nr:hypothetical protein CHH76_15550 [Shouchella clausii]PAE78784.1 hypothetical protein CHH78_19195 [Shouchella clausii]PAF03614.1 hypothetical protein CHH66_19205 [Shouchella clausii]PAF12382.1 hypothetical protein CHH59_18760 [Shouchella clausii]
MGDVLMNVIRGIERYLEEVLIVSILAAMVIVISLQVLLRFVFGTSLGWSEEFSRYCFIWLIFLGASYGVKKQRHIKIDAVLLLLNQRWKVAIGIAANALFLCLALFLFIFGGKIAVQIFQWGQLSPAMDINMGFVYLAAPIGMGIASIRIIQQIVLQYRHGLHHGLEREETDANSYPNANQAVGDK